MKPRLPTPFVDLLSYLDGIGYRELYISTEPSPKDSGVPVEAPSTRPPSTRQRSRSRSPVSPPNPAASETVDRLPTPDIPAQQADIPAQQASPSFAGLSAEQRASELAKVQQEALGCTGCKLCERRQNVVFGTGNTNADLMFVGEGPGAEEDRQGLPFVGAAGELLNKIIRAIEMDRQDVYIANMVKCRPPGNRDPVGDELAACRHFLEQQIDLVQPRLLVALGRVAAQALLGTDLALGKLRGRWHEVRGIPTRVTYHPAALLRFSSYKRPTWEDMQLVRDRLRGG